MEGADKKRLTQSVAPQKQPPKPKTRKRDRKKKKKGKGAYWSGGPVQRANRSRTDVPNLHPEFRQPRPDVSTTTEKTGLLGAFSPRLPGHRRLDVAD